MNNLNNCNNTCFDESYNFKVNMLVLLVFLLILAVVFYYYLNLVIKNKKQESEKIHNIVNNMITENNENNNKEVILFNNEMVENKYHSLVEVLGKESLLEKSGSDFSSATWLTPLDKFNQIGKFGGCDYVRINGYVARKHHPVPASIFVLVGRYMYVPDNLLGPIKYASETINMNQLQVPKPINDHYEETGEKLASLVTGSCGSITISAITVHFVEDMINKYKDIDIVNPLDLYDEFRKEYDRRIHHYLCGKGIVEEIPWYSPEYFNEPEIFNAKIAGCNNLDIYNNIPVANNKNNVPVNNKQVGNNRNNMPVSNNKNNNLVPVESYSPMPSNMELFHGGGHRKRYPSSYEPQ